MTDHPDPHRRQPWLHDLVVALAAPTQAWSGPDGQVRPDGAQGLFHGDVRVLSGAVLTLDGVEPVPVAVRALSAGDVLVVAVPRDLGDPVPDPTVRLERHRRVTPGCLVERLVLTSAATSPVTTQVRVALTCDLARMDDVKGGGRGVPVALAQQGDALVADGRGVHVSVQGDGAVLRGGLDAVLSWDVELPAGGVVELRWEAGARDERAVVEAPSSPDAWDVRVEADDRRLVRWVDRAVQDLRGLRLVTTAAPDQPFLGAGAPWFLTLFGRDSLWAARMTLPLGTELAASTLRLLALHQGSGHDDSSAEEPGKILHELRRDAVDLPDASGGPLLLPPVYYGTVDATALWVCLLHDAWRWGLPDSEVEPLLDVAERALEWMAVHGDGDGDGFLEYRDRSGHGLANQGWKDSGDSVRWRDGSLAAAPVALCEVQGYAHEAAVGGAALLDAFGRPGGEVWRGWAAQMRERFRARFWVQDADGPHPAIALDAAGRAVDTLTSNAGHLLGTGLLSPQEEAAVAARLCAPDMSSGFGLRTLASGQGGWSPLSYHGGSVWPHDTAVVLSGMARGGFSAEAAVLVEGLLAAAEAFDYRLPELYGGDARAEVPVPVPYPAACRPQAWSAAAAVSVLGAVVGLRPEGSPRPLRPSPVGAVRVRGLRRGGRRVGVEVDGRGDGRLVEDP